MKEIFKDILGYEGVYQVSNKGRVKSLDRTITRSNGRKIHTRERVRKDSLDGKGYKQITLCARGRTKTYPIHKLVAIHFLGHKPDGMNIVVDHINGDKTNNRVDNLQIITQRENSSKYRSSTTSMYTGVHLCQRTKKWVAQIQINGKTMQLGRFHFEIHAAGAYRKALSDHLKTKELRE